MSNVNPGNTDPKQLPGKPQIWQVDGRYYVAYYLYGSQTPVVWEATAEELKNQYGGPDAPMPKVDVTMNGAQFQQKSPWLAGRINEIRLTGEDPWTQFYADFNKAAELRPWMREPDMLAVVASAYLEGREPTPDELSKTDWWNRSTEEQRAWFEFSATGGTREVEQRRQDTRRTVINDMLKLGLTKVGDQIIDFITDKVLSGTWSESYYGQQLAKLADPYAPGELNWGISRHIQDEMTQTRREEDIVRDMATTWLGPTMGAMSEQEIKKWAGWMRNDPDAKINFEEHLRKQRLALFPKYTNENLTYEDIVSPFRNLATNIWGQPINDEAMLVDLANTADYTEAARRLRKTGLNQGIGKVVQDALGELGSTSLGDRVVQSAI